mgnify:CR=1 FL=1
MHKLKLAVFLIPALFSLSGCLSFLGPITKEHKILGYPLSETVLIIDEEFVDGSTRVPAGTYRPDSIFSRGVANYVGSEPLSIQLLGLMNRKCFGGVAADFDAPFTNYKLFLYDCGGERIITYSIPKKLKFRIVRKSDLQPLQ